MVFHVALNNEMMLFSIPFEKIQEDGIEICLEDSKTDCNSMIPQVSSRSYCEESVATCETGCNELDSIAEIVNDDESIDHMADEDDGELLAHILQQYDKFICFLRSKSRCRFI